MDSLTTAIQTLLDGLDQPENNVAKPLYDLSSELEGAVQSFLGLQLIRHEMGHPLRLTLFHSADHHPPPPVVQASLRIPLAVLGGLSIGRVEEDHLTFYASTPGAFVDLAADLTYALALAAQIVVVDRDLSPIGRTSGIFGTAEVSAINHAIGILLDWGHHLDDALARLRQDADRLGISVHEQALIIIRTTTSPATDPSRESQ